MARARTVRTRVSHTLVVCLANTAAAIARLSSHHMARHPGGPRADNQIIRVDHGHGLCAQEVDERAIHLAG